MANSVSSAVSTLNGGVIFTPGMLAYQSREIIFKAQPLTRLAALVEEKRDLTLNPGLSINFLRYNDLDDTDDITLTELVPMESHHVTGSLVPIQVREIGYKVAVTELLLQATFTDIMADATQLMGTHYAIATDKEIRDVAYTSGNIMYSHGGADRTGITATDTLTWDLIQDAVEFMAINKAPKYRGDRYIMVIHPSQGKTLRRDQRWIDAHIYGNSTPLFEGEIGKIENVGFVESTMIARIAPTTGVIWTDNKASAQTVTPVNATVATYKAIMIGDHAIGHAIAKDIELRDNGVIDMGRIHEIGYYGIRGFGLIESDHILIIETA